MHPFLIYDSLVTKHIFVFLILKDGRRQTMAEYEKKLIQDYKRRSQQNLNAL